MFDTFTLARDKGFELVPIVFFSVVNISYTSSHASQYMS